MDVAKRLAEWRDRPPEQWFTTVNQYLPPGVTGVLVIAIAYQLATLTWTLVPGSTPSVAPPSRSPITVTPPPQITCPLSKTPPTVPPSGSVVPAIVQDEQFARLTFP